MFKNLLSKEGLITTRNFFNPCSNVRAITKEKTTFQEEKRTHERIQKEAQESWTLVDEEKMLEPEIEEFLACCHQILCTRSTSQKTCMAW
jgi:hypothetical protein